MATHEIVQRRVVRRTVDTAEIEAQTDVVQRAKALNTQIQALAWNHNEVRRLMPLLLNALVEIVTAKGE